MNPASADERMLAEILPAFISEAHEQIENYEQLMLRLEDAPGDDEMLNALFRCAHTIKGSAGLFGLEAIVGFTHHVETLLDRLRGGELSLTAALSTLLLRANDHIRRLVDRAAGKEQPLPAGLSEAGLVAQLREAAGALPGAEPGAAGESAAAREVCAAGTAVRADLPWQVDVRFGAATFRNGMDPLTVVRYVAGLGAVEAMDCLTGEVPMLEVLDPECCHLHLRFTVDGAVERSRLASAFDFVRDDSQVDIQAAAPAPVGSGAAQAAAAPVCGSGSATVPPAEASADSGATRTAPREAAAEINYIRVQAGRLDGVIDLLGELVSASAGAILVAQDARNRTLLEANLRIGQLVEEIRNGTLQLRMVPIGDTFARFRRVVRDTAGELGKQVRLELVGGETELDKAVVERIADPLMHLVRNALDHGLELPADREAAGKPAEGTLTLSAAHDSGAILITIRDDGRGMQRERILQRARERGLVAREQTPSEDEILDLIFEPGFSTADTVTSLSGRGVGMDVVRRNIEALRGSVTVASVAGEGSCISIRLPLTLAIIDGFLVGVGDSRFVLPLESVLEVVEMPAATGFDRRGRAVIELRGGSLPVIDLRRLFALDSPAGEQPSVLVVRDGVRRFGVAVDRLHGQHQTVIKPLGRLFRNLRGLAGSSILGDGSIALIIDVAALGALATRAGAQAGSEAGRPATMALSANP